MSFLKFKYLAALTGGCMWIVEYKQQRLRIKQEGEQ